MIGIIDYGAGNIKSMKNAMDRLILSPNSRIVENSEDLKGLDAIILPGVGSFSYLSLLGDMRGELSERIESGVPFLGVCLGLQWLFEKSEESPKTRGLGLLRGEIVRFPKGLPVPQMGWNKIKTVKENELIEGLDGEYFYFVHSYFAKPEKKECVRAVSEYSLEFTSVIAEKNIYATQFHPEKSGKNGLKLLENFLKVVKC